MIIEFQDWQSVIFFSNCMRPRLRAQAYVRLLRAHDVTTAQRADCKRPSAEVRCCSVLGF